MANTEATPDTPYYPGRPVSTRKGHGDPREHIGWEILRDPKQRPRYKQEYESLRDILPPRHRLVGDALFEHFVGSRRQTISAVAEIVDGSERSVSALITNVFNTIQNKDRLLTPQKRTYSAVREQHSRLVREVSQTARWDMIPLSERQVLSLIYIEGKSVEQARRELAIGSQTLQKHLKEGLVRLTEQTISPPQPKKQPSPVLPQQPPLPIFTSKEQSDLETSKTASAEITEWMNVFWNDFGQHAQIEITPYPAPFTDEQCETLKEHQLMPFYLPDKLKEMTPDLLSNNPRLNFLLDNGGFNSIINRSVVPYSGWVLVESAKEAPYRSNEVLQETEHYTEQLMDPITYLFLTEYQRMIEGQQIDIYRKTQLALYNPRTEENSIVYADNRGDFPNFYVGMNPNVHNAGTRTVKTLKEFS